MPYSDAPDAVSETQPAETQTSQSTAKKANTKAKKKPAWRKFKVDLWATNLNDVEFGILKDERNQAKSRQFTKDMNVIGQVLREGERETLIGWRQEVWDEGDGMQRRLVLKTFTESMNWSGSLELLMGRSLQLSHGASIPVTAYSVNLARHDQLIQIERCARKLPLFPERFSFFIQDDDNITHYYRLRRDRFRIGADYTLFDQTGRKIGHLDRHIFNLGGAWKVKLRSAAASRELESTLTLFCAMLRFNRACRKHVAKQYKQITKGGGDTKLDHQEADLYMNPRRVR